MVEIVGHRDTHIDDEPADFSMPAGVHAVGRKDVGRIEAGVAYLERQHAFLRRMRPDCDPWAEEKKWAEEVMAAMQRIRDRIWDGFVPLSERMDETMTDDSPAVRYAQWNVENIKGRGYSDGVHEKPSVERASGANAFRDLTPFTSHSGAPHQRIVKLGEYGSPKRRSAKKNFRPCRGLSPDARVKVVRDAVREERRVDEIVRGLLVDGDK